MTSPPARAPLRVLVVTPTLQGGGAERFARSVVKGLARDRFQPSVAVFWGGDAAVPMVPADVAVHDLARPGRLALPRLALRLRALLRRTCPDVVFSLPWYGNAVSVLAVRSMKDRPALVVSERIFPSLGYESLGRRAPMVRASIRALYPGADLVVANTRMAADDLVVTFGLRRERVRWVHNPVDIDLVASESRREPTIDLASAGPGPIVMAAGRMVPEKGFEHLIAAMVDVTRHYPRARLVLVGDGPLREALAHESRRLGLEPPVQIVPAQDNPFPYLAQADVFVLPSLVEGFPNVLVEAMALGRPVVASRCPSGPEEILTDGVNGLLVPTADPGALAGSVGRLLGDPALRAELGVAARARACEFDLARQVGLYGDLLYEAAR